MFIDSHCHLDMEDFDSDRDEVIARAESAGVRRMVSIGDASSPAIFQRSLDLVRAHPWIRTTVGIHPHNARLFDRSVAAFMTEASKDPAVIAWGEIGLDFHYNLSPPEDQRAAFEAQVRMANDRGLPVIVHSRESDDDLHSILSRHFRPGRLNGIMHCFTGDADLANRMVELGFMISFSGIVTFPKAEKIREAVASLPEEMILVETDSPYLAPVPHRGKRNEPSFVVRVAETVADIRKIDVARVATATAGNFQRMFPEVFHESG
ncbi:MAG: TatD family hydrolase [Acidobacteriota bacterium]